VSVDALTLDALIDRICSMLARAEGCPRASGLGIALEVAQVSHKLIQDLIAVVEKCFTKHGVTPVCNAEESAQLSSAPRGGRQPDRHLLLLQTSAGSSSSRKRCARHTMSIAVRVRVSAVCARASCLLHAAYTAYHLPPTICCLPLTSHRLPPTPCAYHLPPAACRLPPAPAHAAWAAYVPPTTCIVHTSMYPYRHAVLRFFPFCPHTPLSPAGPLRRRDPRRRQQQR
jgi:hypothetical protein